MSDIQQPRELTPEELEAAGEAPDFLPGDPDGAKWTEEAKQAARAAAVVVEAEGVLFKRDVNRAADRLEKERSGAGRSWARVDTSELYDTEQELPTVGAFHLGETSNGGGVFYAGKVNEIHGPSESGKTMILLWVAVQEIRAGNSVVMIDFEDDAKSIINRLRHVFGLTKDQIEERFWYIQPETAFDEDGYQVIAEIENLTFCIIDAATESLSISGYNGRDEGEVALWYNTFPKKLAKLGVAIAVVDHTGQENLTRAIGSQHKKSAINGVSYTAEPVAQLVKGGRGQLRLKIAKDKPGGIRPDSLPSGDGGQFWRGDFKIDGRGDPNHPKVELYGINPALLNPQPSAASATVAAPQLPPPALAPLVVALADDGEWMAKTDIEKAIGATGDEKDRTRVYANRVVRVGLAEKKDFGGTVKYKITADGIHSANAWMNRAREERQTKIE